MSVVPLLYRDWWDAEDWLERPSRLLDQHFGVGLRRDDLLDSLRTFPRSRLLRNYQRPWNTSHVLNRQESGSTIQQDKDKFQGTSSTTTKKTERQESESGPTITPLTPSEEILQTASKRGYSQESGLSTSILSPRAKDCFQVILDVQQFAPEEITVKTSGNSIVVEGKHEEKQDEHGFISRHFVRRYILPSEHDINEVVSSLSSDGILTVTAPKKSDKPSGDRVVPIQQTGPAKQTVTSASSSEESQPKVEQPTN